MPKQCKRYKKKIQGRYDKTLLLPRALKLRYLEKTYNTCLPTYLPSYPLHIIYQDSSIVYVTHGRKMTSVVDAPLNHNKQTPSLRHTYLHAPRLTIDFSTLPCAFGTLSPSELKAASLSLDWQPTKLASPMLLSSLSEKVEFGEK